MFSSLLRSSSRGEVAKTREELTAREAALAGREEEVATAAAKLAVRHRRAADGGTV